MAAADAQIGLTKPLLYHGPPTRSARIFWLLRELGVDFDVIPVDLFAGDLSKPEYLAINPLGTAPAYRDAPGTPFMYESGAIVEFILAKYGSGRLVPIPGSAQHAVYLQQLWFAEATFSQAVVSFLNHAMLLPEDKRVPHLKESFYARVTKLLGVYEQSLNHPGAEYLALNMFTAADIMSIHGLYLIFEVAKSHSPADYPLLAAYYARITSRPGFKEAYTKPTPEVLAETHAPAPVEATA